MGRGRGSVCVEPRSAPICVPFLVYSGLTTFSQRPGQTRQIWLNDILMIYLMLCQHTNRHWLQCHSTTVPLNYHVDSTADAYRSRRIITAFIRTIDLETILRNNNLCQYQNSIDRNANFCYSRQPSRVFTTYLTEKKKNKKLCEL